VRSNLTWMVGGQQGDGFTSSGETFALGLNRLGYFIYGYFTNSSRILGGHANYRVRINSKKRAANADEIDILAAFDLETIQTNVSLLRDNGLVLCDQSLKVELPINKKLQLIQVPMYAIAEELGNKIVKNMVAVGASAAMIGISPDIFFEMMEHRFAKKGDKVVAMNVSAIQRGYDYVKENYTIHSNIQLDEVPLVKRMLMTGNDAIGLGSIAAGCRAMYAYPITPATDIMESLAKSLPKLGGIVLQTEDEIAAINMVIGSSYAGARAMTATSGPGFSLMMEAIGLSGMTETPVVIVNTQRGGPSTGLPTKHEQSDLFAALYGTHGEIPKIVLAPSTAEECFYAMIQAFNLAEIYQCPVIVLTDLALSQATQTVNYIEPEFPIIDRGHLTINPQDFDFETLENDLDRFKPYKRYEHTESGISPRVIPGTPKGIHHVTGIEHNEFGRPSETAANRREMMDKRLRKMEGMHIPDRVEIVESVDSNILLIGWGSTRGAIEEARERLTYEGIITSHAQIKVLLPFPTEILMPLIEQATTVIVIENNSTGQLASYIRQHVECADKMDTLLKYNGEPFYPLEIEQKIKGMNLWQQSNNSATK
jgi:2-oxoglutarate ferredoxin oxidoreductase subunit alpha